MILHAQAADTASERRRHWRARHGGTDPAPRRGSGPVQGFPAQRDQKPAQQGCRDVLHVAMLSFLACNSAVCLIKLVKFIVRVCSALGDFGTMVHVKTRVRVSVPVKVSLEVVVRALAQGCGWQCLMVQKSW